MSEAERVVERPVEKKRDRERDFYGDTAFCLPVLLLWMWAFCVALEATRTCGQTADWTCITKTGHWPIITCSNAT